MASVRFILKEPKSTEKTLIYLKFTFNCKTLRYSISEKIHPKHWNAKKQRARVGREFQEAEELNFRLDKMEATANTIYRKILNDNSTPTIEGIKKLFNEHFRPERANPQKSDNLVDFFKTDIVPSKCKKQGKKSNYYSVFRTIERMQLKQKRPILLSEVNLKFCTDFTIFLENEGCKRNTIKEYLQKLKSSLDIAFDNGLITDTSYKSKKNTYKGEESDTIYFSIEELEKIYLLDLVKRKPLTHARDRFLLNCFTGLRYVDSDLKNAAIINNTKLEVQTQKTNTRVIIPLHPIAREILLKYKDNGLPKKTKVGAFNRMIRIMANLAGIDENVTHSYTRGGVRCTELIPKYKLAGSHTARRTCATLLYLAGLPIYSIMLITGHKTEDSFRRYIRISKEENATILQENPFFQGKHGAIDFSIPKDTKATYKCKELNCNQEYGTSICTTLCKHYQTSE